MLDFISIIWKSSNTCLCSKNGIYVLFSWELIDRSRRGLSTLTEVEQDLAPEGDQTNLGLTYRFKGNVAFLYCLRFFFNWKFACGWKGEGQLEKRQDYVEIRILYP